MIVCKDMNEVNEVLSKLGLKIHTEKQDDSDKEDQDQGTCVCLHCSRDMGCYDDDEGNGDETDVDYDGESEDDDIDESEKSDNSTVASDLARPLISAIEDKAITAKEAKDILREAFDHISAYAEKQERIEKDRSELIQKHREALKALKDIEAQLKGFS